MSYDISEHKCVNKDKVNSLVKSLETMKNEKSDLKMAVYKQFDSLGEQFTDILYQNNYDVGSSCCIVPIKGQLAQHIHDDPDAMKRAQIALEDQGESEQYRVEHTCANEPEECVIERKPFPLTLKDILCDSNCDDTTSCCIIPIIDHTIRRIHDDPEAMRRAQRALEGADEVPRIPAPEAPKKSENLTAAEMTVFGAIGGRARQMCVNCDKNEASNDSKIGLCNECQLYQKQYNKPRPSCMRENSCLYCCATIWMESKSGEILYCENCKHRVLSTAGKEIASTEYNVPMRDEFKDLRMSIIQKYATATKQPMELEPVSTKKNEKEAVSKKDENGTFEIEAGKPIEFGPKKIDAKVAKEALATKIKEPVLKGKGQEQAVAAKVEAPMELKPISKPKDLKETPAVKPKEPVEVRPVSKPNDLKQIVATKVKDPPISKAKDVKETHAVKVKEAPTSMKVNEFDSFTTAVKESVSDKLSQESCPALPFTRKSSKTVSADYGGEQCCDCEGIRPFRKKSKSNCVEVANDNSEDRFILRGVIKNQSYDQTEQAREGSSSGSGLPERKHSDENLLDLKRSSNSTTSCGADVAPSEPDVSSSVPDSTYFKRDESSAEQENESFNIRSRSSTTAHRNGNDEKRFSSIEDIDTSGPMADRPRGNKSNRDQNSKDRYCFEDSEAFPALTDKLSKQNA